MTWPQPRDKRLPGGRVDVAAWVPSTFWYRHRRAFPSATLPRPQRGTRCTGLVRATVSAELAAVIETTTRLTVPLVVLGGMSHAGLRQDLP